MNYSEDEHEYAELKAQFHQERMLEPTEPHGGGYLLVDDNQAEEPIAFRCIDGAVEYALDELSLKDFSIYKLTKVL